jgi:hypothetical protein
MDLIVPDDDGIPTSYRQPVEMGPKQSQRFTAYARPGGRDTEFRVRLVDSRGRRVYEAADATLLPNPPIAMMPDETVILMMGQPQGVDQIPSLSGFSAGGQGRSTSGGSSVVVARLDAQSGLIPGRWYGFDVARAIVVDTSDRSTLEALDALKGQALVEWVRHGGHLVVTVGGNWQAVRDSVLGPILPAVLAGEERVPSLGALDTFTLGNKPLTPPGTAPLMVTKLESVEERGGKILSNISSLPLIVRGAVGFGRVTLIGVDSSQELFSHWDDRGLFWARAIDLKADRSDQASNGAPIGGGGGRFYQSGVTDLSSQLRIGLEQFPNVKLIPFGWVAFFIFLYILLIGPGDYFFLKKVLKRMELTWITFPTIVISVSLLAYFAAYRLKGNELLVNKVDVVDVDQTSGLLRGRSIASVFSPQNHDYNIGFIPLAADLEQEIPPATLIESATVPRPSAGTELVTSWFSVPEPQFAAMGGSNRRFSFVGSGYAYEPVSAMERLENVRIPIWSTKTLTARWFGQSNKLIDADLRRFGNDRLAGTVTNRLNYPLKDAILAFGKQVYLLETLAPGQTIKVELAGDRNLSGYLGSNRQNYLPVEPWNRNFKINRAQLLQSVMFHEGEASRVNEQTLGNATLHDLDLTGQLALERPMLVAVIDRPGAQLALGNVPSTPKVDQTSLLRVILPLKAK